jgi:hypothetical protein
MFGSENIDSSQQVTTYLALDGSFLVILLVGYLRHPAVL